jgi:hypothetical protein
MITDGEINHRKPEVMLKRVGWTLTHICRCPKLRRREGEEVMGPRLASQESGNCMKRNQNLCCFTILRNNTLDIRCTLSFFDLEFTQPYND